MRSRGIKATGSPENEYGSLRAVGALALLFKG